MTITVFLGLLGLGLAVGFVSGLLGIGGAILIIPALTLVFGFTQPMAVGTSLAFLLPPIGYFAVKRYYDAGLVSVPAAGVLGVAFAVGAYAASTLVTGGKVPHERLRYLFALFLAYVAANTLLKSDARVWAAARTAAVVAGLAVAHALFRALGRRWDRRLDPVEIYRARRAPLPTIDYQI